MQCRCQHPPARHVRRGQGYAQSTDHGIRLKVSLNRPVPRDVGLHGILHRVVRDRPTTSQLLRALRTSLCSVYVNKPGP